MLALARAGLEQGQRDTKSITNNLSHQPLKKPNQRSGKWDAG